MQETFCLLLEGVVTIVITLSSALAFRAATRPRPHDSHLDAATLGRGTQKRLLETTTGWQLVFRQTAPLAWPSGALETLSAWDPEAPCFSSLGSNALEKYRGASPTASET